MLQVARCRLGQGARRHLRWEGAGCSGSGPRMHSAAASSLRPCQSESPGCKAVRYSRPHRLLGAGESLPPCLGPCGRHSSPLLSLSVERACVSSHLPAKAIEPWSPHPSPHAPAEERLRLPQQPWASLPQLQPLEPALLRLLSCHFWDAFHLRSCPQPALPCSPCILSLPLQILLGAQIVPILLMLPWTQSVPHSPREGWPASLHPLHP